jgi:hypothetical protein
MLFTQGTGTPSAFMWDLVGEVEKFYYLFQDDFWGVFEGWRLCQFSASGYKHV